MPRWLRNSLVVALALLLAGAGLWRWLTAREPVPETTSYTIDLEALHALAESMPGPKPRAIRSALVAEASMPRGAVFAGEPLAPHPQVHQVFQVLFASGYGLIDAGFPAATFEQMQAFGDGQGRFHAETFDAVTRAFTGADWIVVTHEHFDHLAGVSALPVEHAPRLRLNAAQLANTRALDDSEVPAALRAALAPLPEREAQALAPGVVLLAAPGHTPGSQIVYVERQDGRRALFLGDVAWHGRQIRELHYRPRLVTLLLGEDRAQVMGQLRALHTLGAAQPEVAQVVSHDAEQRAALLADGLLLDGLEPAP